VSVLLLQFYVLPYTTSLDSAERAEVTAGSHVSSGRNSSFYSGHETRVHTQDERSGNLQSATELAQYKPDAVPKATGSSPGGRSDSHSKEWPNTIAICALMKTEHAEDVVEWLDYHRCVCTAILTSCC
jgi:hypothetical protein